MRMKQTPNELFFTWMDTEISEGNSVRFRLKGQSMFPLLRNERDEVVIYPCVADELQPMDVVLFRYQGKHVLHRILRREGELLYLQGDGSYLAKEACRTTDVVGKLREVVRHSGKVIQTDGWQWRFLSRLWWGLGFLRVPCLRILHRLF